MQQRPFQGKTYELIRKGLLTRRLIGVNFAGQNFVRFAGAQRVQLPGTIGTPPIGTPPLTPSSNLRFLANVRFRGGNNTNMDILGMSSGTLGNLATQLLRIRRNSSNLIEVDVALTAFVSKYSYMSGGTGTGNPGGDTDVVTIIVSVSVYDLIVNPTLRSASGATIYVNGLVREYIPFNIAWSTNQFVPDTAFSFTIGAAPSDSPAAFFNGDIGQVRAWLRDSGAPADMQGPYPRQNPEFYARDIQANILAGGTSMLISAADSGGNLVSAQPFIIDQTGFGDYVKLLQIGALVPSGPNFILNFSPGVPLACTAGLSKWSPSPNQLSADTLNGTNSLSVYYDPGMTVGQPIYARTATTLNPAANSWIPNNFATYTAGAPNIINCQFLWPGLTASALGTLPGASWTQFAQVPDGGQATAYGNPGNGSRNGASPDVFFGSGGGVTQLADDWNAGTNRGTLGPFVTTGTLTDSP